MAKYLTYSQTGVNIDANETMVRKIESSVQATFGPRVINLHGGFAGLFRVDYDEKLFKKNYKNPVLIACTDGVGTKVLLARDLRKFDTVGCDLVAMSVNDMLVLGAEPLFFLDYLGIDKLEPEKVAVLIESIAGACRTADCALIGGETAEMPDIYRKNDFDMAGFAVGIVEKNRIIDGSKVACGDAVLGLASNGLHSNGFSLARHICFKKLKLRLNEKIAELENRPIGELLLEPTRIYVRPIIKLLSQYKLKRVVHAMAHITGGGIAGNLHRVLPENCDAVISKSKWPRQRIFEFLRKNGPVKEAEMYRTFNMGIGFILVVSPDFANSITNKLTRYGEKVYRLGTIRRGNRKVIIN